MRNTSSGGDPVIDFIVGKGSRCSSLVSSVAVTFVSCLVLSAVAASEIVQAEFAFGAVALLVCVVSWRTSPANAVVVAVVAFLFADGFVFDQLGTLEWHGEGDVVRLVLLVLVALIASMLGHLPPGGRRPSAPWSARAGTRGLPRA